MHCVGKLKLVRRLQQSERIRNFSELSLSVLCEILLLYFYFSSVWLLDLRTHLETKTKDLPETDVPALSRSLLLLEHSSEHLSPCTVTCSCTSWRTADRCHVSLRCIPERIDRKLIGTWPKSEQADSHFTNHFSLRWLEFV